MKMKTCRTLNFNMRLDFNSKNKILALAPMADYTDQPFSLICRDVSGGNFVIYREMVSAEAIVRGNQKTLAMCKISKKERPVIIQLFGDKPKVLAEAASVVCKEFKPDGIDINMGCPAPKIAQKTRAGAALMRHPDLAEDIVKTIKNLKLNVPLSIKTRLGWNNSDDIFDFAKRMENAGVDFIAVHGRTKAQGYSGIADWIKIGELKKKIKLPIIANGDVLNAVDAKKCLEITGAEGLMIGRGALGNPWIFKQITDSKIKISKKEFINVILRHADLHLERYGERGMITFRKHLVWYFHGQRAHGIENLKKIRTQLVRISSKAELSAILSSI